jgi:cytochrome P450
VLGTPTILSSDVELTKTVYQQTNKLFRLAIPSTTSTILGKESLFFMPGDIHRKVRNLIKGPFSVRELESFIPTIDKTCQDAMASWQGQKQIRVYHEAKKVTTSLSSFFVVHVNCIGHRFKLQV